MSPATGRDNVHLSRLLPETEKPWYASLKENLGYLFEKEPPPLQVTSKPVPVKDIWGDYRYGKISGPASVALHIAVVGLLLVSGKIIASNPHVQKLGRDIVSIDIAPYIPAAAPKPAGGGGGGGERAQFDASKGRLPRQTLDQQLTPPVVVIRNENPKLVAEPTIVVQPDIKLPQTDILAYGDPLSKVLGPLSGGRGAGGGIGDGYGGGVGPGKGGGFGPGEGGNVGGGAFRVGSGVSAPVLIYRVEPEYTEEARKAKYQGTVVLAAVVDPDGKIRQVRVQRSLGLGLDEKALEAVRQWRFKPGQRNGQAVPVTASIEVTFRLL